jgi:hypothetical protein
MLALGAVGKFLFLSGDEVAQPPPGRASPAGLGKCIHSLIRRDDNPSTSALHLFIKVLPTVVHASLQTLTI